MKNYTTHELSKQQYSDQKYNDQQYNDQQLKAQELDKQPLNKQALTLSNEYAFDSDELLDLVDYPASNTAHLSLDTILQLGADAKRIIQVDGSINFRELGGYQSQDGRSVKAKKLFRSGANHRLADHSASQLSALNIDVIFDLRSTEERQNAPTLLSRFSLGNKIESIKTMMKPSQTAWDYSLEFDSDNHLKNKSLSLYEMSAAVDEIYKKFYQRLPTDFGPRIQAIFNALLNDKTILFHCTAGKDRTGLIAFLILNILGVSREQIYKDYLLTNEMVTIDEKINKLQTEQSVINNQSTINSVNVDTLPQVITDQLARVKSKYLEFAENTILSQFDSIKDYVIYHTKIDNNQIEKIKDLYLV